MGPRVCRGRRRGLFRARTLRRARPSARLFRQTSSTSPAGDPGLTARTPAALGLEHRLVDLGASAERAVHRRRTCGSCRTGNRPRPRRSRRRPRPLRSMTRSPGRPCGLAEFGPEATMVSKARSSAPRLRIATSRASATSDSVASSCEHRQRSSPRAASAYAAAARSARSLRRPSDPERLDEPARRRRARRATGARPTGALSPGDVLGFEPARPPAAPTVCRTRSTMRLVLHGDPTDDDPMHPRRPPSRAARRPGSCTCRR